MGCGTRLTPTRRVPRRPWREVRDANRVADLQSDTALDGGGLEVRDLRTEFRSEENPTVAIKGVSLLVRPGESLGIVGESGCGKSVTALSIMRLIKPPGFITSGEVMWGGRDLLTLKETEMQRIRGSEIGMVFQDPLAYLNPVMTIGSQIEEAVRLHLGLNRTQSRRRVIDLLGMVGLSGARSLVQSYPHELSGGMRQRVLIAIAISCEPRLLIADEPTTALDVTIQAGVLDLLQRLRAELGMSLVLITHDLAVVADMVDHVVVMYAGRIVESSSAELLYSQPKHPYTLGLLRSVPRIDDEPHERLPTIEGMPPDPRAKLAGCPYRPRCEFAVEKCGRRPPLLSIEDDRGVACWVDVRDGHLRTHADGS